MKRRTFIAGAATGAVLGAGATYLATGTGKPEIAGGTPEAPAQAPNVASGALEWKMVTTWPKNFPGAGTTAQFLADRITEMSGGRLKVNLYAAGELVPAFESFDAVREGIAECAHAAPYYWVAKNKSIPFFCAVPGGLTLTEHNAWVHFGGGQALWDEVYGEFGVRGFMAGNTGTQMGGWFKREINSLEDLKGLKFRIPGLGAEVINRLGGTAVNMPGGEIMPALESGVIDAAEWVGPWNDLAFGFYKVAKNYYGPGFHEGSTCNELMINEAAWSVLTDDLKAIVRAASHETNQMSPAEYMANNAWSLPKLLDEHGVILNHYPDDVAREMFRVSEEVVAETADEGDLNRRIYESWSTFRRQVMDYAPLGDYGFARMRSV